MVTMDTDQAGVHGHGLMDLHVRSDHDGAR